MAKTLSFGADMEELRKKYKLDTVFCVAKGEVSKSGNFYFAEFLMGRPIDLIALLGVLMEQSDQAGAVMHAAVHYDEHNSSN